MSRLPSPRRILAAIAPAPSFAIDVAEALYARLCPFPWRCAEVLDALHALERAGYVRARRARHAALPLQGARRLYGITRRGRRSLARGGPPRPLPTRRRRRSPP